MLETELFKLGKILVIDDDRLVCWFEGQARHGAKVCAGKLAASIPRLHRQAFSPKRSQTTKTPRQHFLKAKITFTLAFSR
jgi:hypothetical protein